MVPLEQILIDQRSSSGLNSLEKGVCTLLLSIFCMSEPSEPSEDFDTILASIFRERVFEEDESELPGLESDEETEGSEDEESSEEAVTSRTAILSISDPALGH